jgi:hypothetical protein
MVVGPRGHQIYLLNLLIGFLSPQADPETEGPALPTKGNDEFKPFIRRLPEFKFCALCTDNEETKRRPVQK